MLKGSRRQSCAYGRRILDLVLIRVAEGHPQLPVADVVPVQVADCALSVACVRVLAEAVTFPTAVVLVEHEPKVLDGTYLFEDVSELFFRVVVWDVADKDDRHMKLKESKSYRAIESESWEDWTTNDSTL